MKSPNKLVGVLLVSALTVGSVFPVDLGAFASMGNSLANNGSKVVRQLGKSIANNPVKTGAIAVAAAGAGLVAHKYVQIREQQAEYVRQNPNFEFDQPKTDALRIALLNTVDRITMGLVGNYLQTRERQAEYVRQNPNFEFDQPRTDALRIALQSTAGRIVRAVAPLGWM